jgi:hypothetical protein
MNTETNHTSIEDKEAEKVTSEVLTLLDNLTKIDKGDTEALSDLLKKMDDLQRTIDLRIDEVMLNNS